MRREKDNRSGGGLGHLEVSPTVFSEQFITLLSCMLPTEHYLYKTMEQINSTMCSIHIKKVATIL